MRIKILATGACVPEHVVTNDELAERLDTSDEWISTRTGIRARHIAADGSTTRLAVQAAKQAISLCAVESGGTAEAERAAAEAIDLVLVASSTPDKHFPSCACEVQGAIGAVHATAFDLSAACSGFLFAYNTAYAYFRAGLAKRALVIGADVMSKTLDWTDRSSCVLFGDAAGAVLLEAEPEPETAAVFDGEAKAQDRTEVPFCTLTGSDGARGHVLSCAVRYGTEQDAAEGTAEGQTKRYALSMDGQEVFKFAVKTVSKNIQELMLRAARQERQSSNVSFARASAAKACDAQGGCGAGVLDEAIAGVYAETNATVDADMAAALMAEVKYFVLHQANVRIIEAVAKKLGQPMEKFPVNLAGYGNTSAASVPLLLDELFREKKLNRGDRLVIAGFGAGLTYGATLFTV